jgi:hypothetical protein
MIPQSFGTYVSPKNLGLSPVEVHCSLENNHVPQDKEQSSLGNLGPSPNKIHCSPRKLYFSSRNFSYSIGTCWGLAFNLLLLGEVIF